MDQRFEITEIVFNGGSGYRQVGQNGIVKIEQWRDYLFAEEPLSYRVDLQNGSYERIFGVHIVNYAPVEVGDSGVMVSHSEHSEPQAVLDQMCPACHGMGVYLESGSMGAGEYCHACNGMGRIKLT